MPSNSGTFAELFAFSRDRAAPFVDGNGNAETAAIDVPRLDHDEAGIVKGLLIEGRPQTLQADVVVLQANLPGAPVQGTVLHDYIDAGGDRWQRAIYTRSPRATVEGCLALKGWHRRIGFFPAFLPRSEDHGPTRPVRYEGESWEMCAFVVDVDGQAIDIGDVFHSILIEA
mgnify:CR=1 FL=1